MTIFFKDQRLVHMSKNDAYIWSKFLEQHETEYTNYRYDIRVGAGVKLDDSAPDWLKKSAENLSQKRIDVIADDAKNVYVFEVRHNATAAVIGQLVCYVYLYRLKFNPIKPVIPIMITDAADADLVIAMRELNLVYFIV